MLASCKYDTSQHPATQLAAGQGSGRCKIDLAPPARGCFIMASLVRIWRNWQTRYFEVVVE